MLNYTPMDPTAPLLLFQIQRPGEEITGVLEAPEEYIRDLILRANLTQKKKILSGSQNPNREESENLQQTNLIPIKPQDCEKTIIKKPTNKKASRLPDDWAPTFEVVEWAKTARPGIDIQETIEDFRDYWHSSGGRNATKLNWDLAFKNWIRKVKIQRYLQPPKEPVRQQSLFTATRLRNRFTGEVISPHEIERPEGTTASFHRGQMIDLGEYIPI